MKNFVTFFGLLIINFSASAGGLTQITTDEVKSDIPALMQMNSQTLPSKIATSTHNFALIGDRLNITLNPKRPLSASLNTGGNVSHFSFEQDISGIRAMFKDPQNPEVVVAVAKSNLVFRLTSNKDHTLDLKQYPMPSVGDYHMIARDFVLLGDDVVVVMENAELGIKLFKYAYNGKYESRNLKSMDWKQDHRLDKIINALGISAQVDNIEFVKTESDLVFKLTLRDSKVVNIPASLAEAYRVITSVGLGDKGEESDDVNVQREKAKLDKENANRILAKYGFKSEEKSTPVNPRVGRVKLNPADFKLNNPAIESMGKQMIASTIVRLFKADLCGNNMATLHQN